MVLVSEKPLNIYMVVWKFFPCSEGGAERQCRKLVTHLSKQGHFCTVLTSRLNRGLTAEEVLSEGYSIQRVGRFAWIEEAFKKVFRKIRGTISSSDKGQVNDAIEFWFALPFVWISRLSFMFALKSFLKKNRNAVDVVHVHEAHWIAGSVAWACQGFGLPVVCKEASFPAVEQLSYDTPFRRTLARLRKQLHFIALTDAVADSLKQIGISTEQINTVPNGVELPEESVPVIGTCDIVYIGNLTQGAEWKAFDILFEAWVLAQKQDQGRSRLVVLGAGNPDTWKKYLDQHGCPDSVYFAGAVKDVDPYLRHARLFLLPSRVEGMSNALLEAMSWGVPAVVSDIPANRSLIRHGINGWVVPVNDSRALADAIITLLADEALSLRLGRAARQEIEKSYTIERIATRLVELYTKLIAKNRHNVSSGKE
ncbi:MAG: glycosyltransferase family 1 protein [Candidatus Electrothrix sp. AW3_4]|nr:glycosyltransferase family 1 protein [Candidatus Electrothrix gigas]